MFEKVLIANRGEIACRVIRTCKRLGIKTVAVHSTADAKSPQVAMADEAVLLGEGPVAESYLNVPRLLEACKSHGVDAVHPGYGLLSENASFAEAIRAAGMVFVGPSVEVLNTFGDKIQARTAARDAGVMPPPGSDGPVEVSDMAAIEAQAEEIGYPVMVKAAGGGGGIGMQIVKKPTLLAKAVTSCSDRGKAAFADERVYLERYLDTPRHIEVQILGDSHGNVLSFGERECSMQRRHQKVIEECPSPAAFFEGEAGEERRKSLHKMARDLVQASNYCGAATVEFIANGAGEIFFLEVNARLQVEHPVTEMVFGIDLVEWQLRVAAGEALPADLAQKPQGHSIEARLYAEDPMKKFAPQPGHLERLRWPEANEQLRIEAGITEGQDVTPFYDPMLAKVVAYGENREAAIARLKTALEATELSLVGPTGQKSTNLVFLGQLLSHESFVSGAYDTAVAEQYAKQLRKQAKG